MQLTQQQLRVAKNQSEFINKLEMIRQEIRPLVRKDLLTISKLTGIKNIRYEDILSLKRSVREILLQTDADSI